MNIQSKTFDFQYVHLRESLIWDNSWNPKPRFGNVLLDYGGFSGSRDREPCICEYHLKFATLLLTYLRNSFRLPYPIDMKPMTTQRLRSENMKNQSNTFDLQ